MPTLLEATDISLETSDLLKRYDLRREYSPSGQLVVPPRTSGVHLSGVLQVIAVAIGVLKPSEPIEEDLPLICALGFMWEEFAASLYPNLTYQPGEIEQDGVLMTCDGLGQVQSERSKSDFCVEEFKYTRKALLSAEEFLADSRSWYWRGQGVGYCKGYGAELVRWHVLYANGDYKWGCPPTYRRYLVRFSPKEIEQNWEMILRSKDKATPEEGTK